MGSFGIDRYIYSHQHACLHCLGVQAGHRRRALHGPGSAFIPIADNGAQHNHVPCNPCISTVLGRSAGPRWAEQPRWPQLLLLYQPQAAALPSRYLRQQGYSRQRGQGWLTLTLWPVTVSMTSLASWTTRLPGLGSHPG